MASDRKLRKFIRQWRKRYPYTLDWVDNRANKQCRRSEATWLAQFEGADVLRRREVRALIEWRFETDPERHERALEGIEGPARWGNARRQIKKALAASNPVAALDHLLGQEGGIEGWGPTESSVVLASCRPQTYVVADPRALRTLKALGLYSADHDDEFLREDWWPLLSRCRNLAKLCGLHIRDVEQALSAAAPEAPSLPKPSKRRPSERSGRSRKR
jgi:hypothetical protein